MCLLGCPPAFPLHLSIFGDTECPSVEMFRPWLDVVLNNLLQLTCASKELDLGVFRGPCQPQLSSAVGSCSCEVAVSSSQGVAPVLHE